MKGKNGETKGRAAAINNPAQVAEEMAFATLCGALETIGVPSKSLPISPLAVVESDCDPRLWLMLVHFVLRREPLSFANLGQHQVLWKVARCGNAGSRFTRPIKKILSLLHRIT